MIRGFHSLRVASSARRWNSSRRSSSSSPAAPRASPTELHAESKDFTSLFQAQYEKQSPALLRNLVAHYPAMEKWNNLDYLLETVNSGKDGVVHCDVEAGAYNSGKKLTVPFESYVDYLLLWEDKFGSGSNQDLCPSDQLLYLAQNELQTFPGLASDIEIPSICTTAGVGHVYQTMLWMGPRGCVSPLHYDPLDNILMQFVGKKRVTLISSQAKSECLYTGEKYGQQHNTSAVNVEDPDLQNHALFAQIIADEPIMEVELIPGDALYIPAKWWHHVRSLDLSVSVNIWWR